MKKLVVAVTVIVILIALITIGCTNKSLIGQVPDTGDEVVSSCITCHTDKETLKAVATTEEGEESGATTGEG